jgi:hypothetical protein
MDDTKREWVRSWLMSMHKPFTSLCSTSSPKRPALDEDFNRGIQLMTQVEEREFVGVVCGKVGESSPMPPPPTVRVGYTESPSIAREAVRR